LAATNKTTYACGGFIIKGTTKGQRRYQKRHALLTNGYRLFRFSQASTGSLYDCADSLPLTLVPIFWMLSAHGTDFVNTLILLSKARVYITSKQAKL
jgi:hypothetical protein